MKLRWIACLFACAAAAQQSQPTFKFEVTTRLVVVNVTVKDRDGNLIKGLKAEDFEVLEDGQPQKLSVFEFQQLDTAPVKPLPARAAGAEAPAEIRSRPQGVITTSKEGEIRYDDRRLIVLYFDFSSMPPEDQIRAQVGAEKFIKEKMTPNDLVAIMGFSTELRVLQDFTDDRDQLLKAIQAFRIGEASDLAGLADTGAETEEDTGAAFVADETEFNIFNTDRKLSALASATDMLATLPEKKALVYFSSGVDKTGVENQSQLRSTVNAALRGNVSFYPVDTRGLVAEAPGGDATRGSTRGSTMYSGQAQRSRQGRFQDQQETLYTLAADTGGKALLDNNDLSLGIVRAQEGISSYYILGYHSTNTAEDGKYRRIKVRLRGKQRAKLEYRQGYFAAKEFKQFTAADREKQLEEAILLGDPITDLTLALEVNYFRRGRDRYVVPVSVKIPGSEFVLKQKRKSDQVRIDFIAQVRNRRGGLAGNVRDHIEVKLTGDKRGQLNQRYLQYDTAFTLPPGAYNLKFLVRENETGKMGTFETGFTIPDLDSEPDKLRMSSVIWANQREEVASAVGAAQRNRKLTRSNPLVSDGRKLIPSITKVFRTDQNLYVFFEVYNPGTIKESKSPSLMADVALYQGTTKAVESEPVRISSFPDEKLRTAPLQLQVPLAKLNAGRYVCQVNIIDQAGKKFAFRRTPLVLLPPAATEPRVVAAAVR